MIINVKNLFRPDYIMPVDRSKYIGLVKEIIPDDINVSLFGDKDYPSSNEIDTNEWSEWFMKHCESFIDMNAVSNEFPDIDISAEVMLMNWLAGNRAAWLAIPSEGDTPVLLPSGVCVLGGLSRTGKSTFLRNLSSRNNIDYVVFGEPDYPSITHRSDLSKELNRFIKSDEPALIIDSISPFLIASGKSAAAAGGVSNDLLEAFVHINNQMAMAGKLLICSLNFGDKVSTIEYLHGAYSGKVSSYFIWEHITNVTITTRLTRVRGTVQDEKRRDLSPIIEDYDNSIASREEKSISKPKFSKNNVGEDFSYLSFSDSININFKE